MIDGARIAADIRKMLLVREGRVIDSVTAAERANNIAMYVVDLLVEASGKPVLERAALWPSREPRDPK